MTAEWQTYVRGEMRREFAAIVAEEGLKESAAREFVAIAWERGYVPEGGLELNALMPPLNPFDPTADRAGRLRRILDRLKAFFARYYTLCATAPLA